MADPRFDTIERIEGLGGNKVHPPRTLHERDAKAGLLFLDGPSLLVAILLHTLG